MNSAYTLATLTRKRAAVAAWIEQNEPKTQTVSDGVVGWHYRYWARLDDAIDYLRGRMARSVNGCFGAGVGCQCGRDHGDYGDREREHSVEG